MLNLLKGLFRKTESTQRPWLRKLLATVNYLSFIEKKNKNKYKVLNYSYITRTTMGNTHERNARGKYVPWSLGIEAWHTGHAIEARQSTKPHMLGSEAGSHHWKLHDQEQVIQGLTYSSIKWGYWIVHQSHRAVVQIDKTVYVSP